MSDLPKGWQLATLPEIANINPGHPSIVPPETFVTFVAMSAISETRPEFKFTETRPYAAVRTGFTKFAEGDVLFAKITPCMENGKGAVARGLENGLGCGTTELFVLRPLDSVIADYIYRFLAQDKIRKQAKDNFTGTAGQARVPKRFVEAIEIPVPPFNEQKRIVEKLEKLLGKVEGAQERLDKIPAILKRFRQSVLAAACSGKLTADWRVGNSAASVANQSEEIPSTWSVIPFGEYVENHDGKRIPIEGKLREKRRGEFPYYGASGIIDSIDGYTHEGEFVLIGEDGANLVARSKPIAFIAAGRFWVNNHAHVVRCKNGFPNQYLSFYINSIDLQPYVTGSAQPKLSQRNMNRISIPVPPFEEQKEIVRRVEELFKFADQIEERYKKARTYTDKLTQSILAKAFRGELVPQDPTDEPASALLERIRKAKV